MQKNLLESALKDIGIIKSSIGENKNPYLKLSKFLLLIGIVNLIYYVAITIGAVLLDPDTFLRYYTNIISTINAILYFLLLIYFVRIYKEENKSLNTYYLGFLSIVAGVILFLPLLMFLTRVMAIFIEPRISGGTLLQLNLINMTANILLFCFIIILCGFILRRKIMFFISTAIFLAFLIISTFYHDFIIYTFSFSKGGSFYLFTTYYSLVVSIGYILIASVLKNKCRVENTNGNS